MPLAQPCRRDSLCCLSERLENGKSRTVHADDRDGISSEDNIESYRDLWVLGSISNL